MKPALDAALDAEPPHWDETVARARLTLRNHPPEHVDVGGLRLRHVKVLRPPYAEADVALVVARLVVLALLAGSVLREVLGRSHDELELVQGIGHFLRVDDSVKVPVHCREVDEGLIVEVREYEPLELVG